MGESLADRFAELLNRHKDLKEWTVMGMTVDVWGDEKQRSRMGRYLKGDGGNPKQPTARKIGDALGIPRTEIDSLYEAVANDWPVIFDPSIRMERRVRGREGDVADLHARLSGGGSVAILPGAVVKGAGGMGKSTLARHYAETYAAQYRGIWWLRAQSVDGLVADLGKLAGHLGLKPGDHATAEALAQAVVMALSREDAPWLLIYDNAETPGAIGDWIPKGKTVLVTSREARWPGFDVQEAGRLSLSDAADLLMQEAERDTDRAGAESLAAALDGLPLALVLAGAWLRDTPGTGFAEYEARIEALIDLKPEEVAVEDYPDSVFGAVSLSLEKLSDDAALLMRVFAYLSPDDLWPGLVVALAQKEQNQPNYEPVPDKLWALSRDRAAVERVFADLTRRSLLERVEEDEISPSQPSAARAGTSLPHSEEAPDSACGTSGEGEKVDPLDESYRMHRLTGTVLRARDADTEDGHPRASPEDLSPDDETLGSSPRVTNPDTETRACGASGEGNEGRAIAAALLAASYPGGERNPQYLENWPDCARRQPHVAALAATPPATAAMDTLLNQASIWLSAQRRDADALASAETSLRLKEARLGPDHAEVGTACNNLASYNWRAGRMVEAEALAARAVAISEVGGVADARRAIWLSTHGIMAEMVGRGWTGASRTAKLALAADRYRQALALNIELQGRVSRAVPIRLNNLADLRAYQGRWGAALPLHGRALALRRQALPPGDPDMASGLINLGATLLKAGRAREGYRRAGVLDLLTEALAIREDAFADNPAHPDRANTARWLVSAHGALAELGSPITGTALPDPARAAALCAAYGLDEAKQKAHAAEYVARARQYESGVEPPGEIDG